MKQKLFLIIILIAVLAFFLFTFYKEEVQTGKPITIETIQKGDDVEISKTRALARWNALIAKDWDKAYSYETPSFRKAYSKEVFSGNFGQAVEWISIKHISSTKISDNIIDIKLELLYLYDMDGNEMKIPSIVDERWQLIDNNWWHVKK